MLRSCASAVPVSSLLRLRVPSSLPAARRLLSATARPQDAAGVGVGAAAGAGADAHGRDNEAVDVAAVRPVVVIGSGPR